MAPSAAAFRAVPTERKHEPMPLLDVNGVAINYTDEGTGPAVVLVHGFAASLQSNWRAPGIIDAVARSGRRVVALDARGHGRSGKPLDPRAYEGTKMSDDVIALMDHLGIDKADLVGYSMGGMLSSSLLVRHPERFRTVTLAGVGDRMLLGGRTREWSEAMAHAMDARSSREATTDTARNFRMMAEALGNDLKALAAMQRAQRAGYDPAKLREVKLPVMVLLGQSDLLVGPADELAAAIPGAKLVKVPGDHLTAVVSPELKRAIIGFLDEHSPVTAK
jgi:pimeloyl-ACP methyl ester carboxylesterase